jgi:Aldo/keto reductase family
MGMRYKLLGRTGLRVSELCLGAMIFGDRRGGWGAGRDEAAGIVERFAEAGGNFIDTANYYAAGESERIVGELTAAERERWVLLTKYTLTMRPDDPNGGGAHRKSLVQSLEGSLRRLRTDYLDLYWVHIWDAFTPVDEVVRALDDVVGAGKVLYVASPTRRPGSSPRRSPWPTCATWPSPMPSTRSPPSAAPAPTRSRSRGCAPNRRAPSSSPCWAPAAASSSRTTWAR